MQYILTEDEYNNRVPITKMKNREDALETARKLIVSDAECENMHYCDDCVIAGIKKGIQSKLLCPKDRRYSK